MISPALREGNRKKVVFEGNLHVLGLHGLKGRQQPRQVDDVDYNTEGFDFLC